MSGNQVFFVGVDVGTGSVRSAVVDQLGHIIGKPSVRPITIWKPETDFYEQSSANIWASVCETVREAVASSKVAVSSITGIGFDATCSLVCLGENGSPVSVSKTGADEQNVILWQDHRAVPEADFINATKHHCLHFVGGTISPEMEPPKILWLKRHLPDQFSKIAHFFDLADFLTYQCTGCTARSMCTVVCKWCYQSKTSTEAASGDSSVSLGWNESFLRAIDLGELASSCEHSQNGHCCARIGSNVQELGAPVGNGLSASAAEMLGLQEGIAVATSAIDAHAGGIGTIGAVIPPALLSTPDLSVRCGWNENVPKADDITNRMAIILGTSACHMTVSMEPCFVNGIWGPYLSAMVPKMWLNEGGQSACGALLDHVLSSHGFTANGSVFSSVFEKANAVLEQWRSSNTPDKEIDFAASSIHVLPDFHGNRSPYADPNARGIVAGLTLSNSDTDVARLYLATVQSLCYQTRDILEHIGRERERTCPSSAPRIQFLFATGGLVKNPVFLAQLANITRCPILLSPFAQECMMIGSACLAAVAAGVYPSVNEAMSAMNQSDSFVLPSSSSAVHELHTRKYEFYHKLIELERLSRSLSVH